MKIVGNKASVRPLLDKLGTQKWTRETPIGETTIGDAYDGQIRFKLVGEGAYSQRHFHADSQAARDLVASDTNRRLDKFFKGFLQNFDGREDDNQLNGLIFNSSPEQFGLQIATNIMHEYMRSGPGDLVIGDSRETTTVEDFDGALKLGSMMGKRSSAMRQDYLGFGPKYTSYLKEMVREGLDDPEDHEKASSLTKVMIHEMEHNTTPFGWYDHFNQKHIKKGLGELSEMHPVRLLELFQPQYWIEEAGTDVLAHWGTRVEQAGDAMGLPNASKEGLPAHRYDRIVHPLEQMLEMAGLSNDNDDHFKAAERLLQEEDLREAPRRLAEAIVEHQNMDPKHIKKLTKKIRKAGKWFQVSGLPAKFRTWRIKRFVNRHAGSGA